MYRYRKPIVHLAEHSILEQPRMTQSIIKAWICRMIDAGWEIDFSDDGVAFTHADEHVDITNETAEKLLKVYWRRLAIPAPYNVDEIAALPLVRIDIEAEPYGT